MGLKDWMGDLVSGGKVSAGKEAKRAGEEEANAQFKADQNAFANREQTRSGSVDMAQSLLSGLFGGKYAIPPGALAALRAPRQSTAVKHAVIDPSKGAGWGGVNKLVGKAIELGTSAVGGANLMSRFKPTVPSAAEPTTLLPTKPGYDFTQLLPPPKR